MAESKATTGLSTLFKRILRAPTRIRLTHRRKPMTQLSPPILLHVQLGQIIQPDLTQPNRPNPMMHRLSKLRKQPPLMQRIIHQLRLHPARIAYLHELPSSQRVSHGDGQGCERIILRSPGHDHSAAGQRCNGHHESFPFSLVNAGEISLVVHLTDFI